jgi:molybdenum cofactor synthesis domain-containing protein
MKRAAVITVSDKGSAGSREDKSGPAVVRILSENGWNIEKTCIIPDEQELIKATLIEYADKLGLELVVTTGGTGFSKRDVTPEATLAVVERQAPGLSEAMRAKSLQITPMAMLSRAAAGIRGETLIVNLPGSEKAARECLEVVLPALGHGIEILKGEASECASIHKRNKD